jgi:hypothetical protein
MDLAVAGDLLSPQWRRSRFSKRQPGSRIHSRPVAAALRAFLHGGGKELEMVRGDGRILASVSRTRTYLTRRWFHLGGHFGVLLTIVVVFTAGCACVTAPQPFPPSTPPFLGPRDFVGTYSPKATAATIGGDATYDGNVVFTNLDRTLVQAILPPELKLAQNSRAPALHPVIYLYGRPTNTSWIVAETSLLVGPNYQELMLLVPFVQESTGTRWHNYVVRMYLDDANAIWIGNVFFAYAKMWGTSLESGTHVTEFDDVSTAKFHANIQPTGSWQPSAQAEASLPNYPAIQAILAMPVVGRRSSGQLVCSYFELDYTNAMVAPVQSTHEFLDPFVSGMSGWVGLGSLSSVTNGAVAVSNLNWRIQQPPPPPCQF